METVLPHLLATEPHPLHFAPSISVRAFRLQRPAGDLILYDATTLGGGDADGAVAQYLNHWHEAMFAGDANGVPTLVHERDRDEAAARIPVDGTFAERATLDGDFEIIPTPGHTPGATAYLWDSGEHRMLFTGDTLFSVDGEWTVAVLGDSDRDAYLESLELLRELDFDVLVPWAASGGQPFVTHTDRADTRRRLDAILARVRAGADR